METFATVASWVYFLFYTLWLIAIFYAFSQLTLSQQARANITINATGIVVYMLAISWIISRFIS